MLIFDTLTVEEFMSIRNESGLSVVDTELVQRALPASLFTLKYERDGKAVGMLRVVGDGAFVAVICDVVVVPEHRRQGIGAALINAALDRIADCMPEGMWIQAMLTCAPERGKYYEKFGFSLFNADIHGIVMQRYVKGG
ncbi:MAG: GNAT family N-acetyltransferase [Oscillospiraceae bacterium]|nr:GNAT family N-acetyltransferase [Oscillospiraceae bacterium]